MLSEIVDSLLAFTFRPITPAFNAEEIPMPSPFLGYATLGATMRAEGLTRR